MKKERDEALYEQYKRIFRECDAGTPYNKIVEMTVNSPQPRMWVSFHGVYRLLRKICYNHGRGQYRAARSGLEDEVRIKYNRLRSNQFFKNASLYFLTSFIIMEPSRGFHISHSHAKRVLWKVRKEHLKNRQS